MGRSSIPQKIRWAVFRRDGFACRVCGQDYDLTVDHIVPVVLGGSSDPDNLQTLCGPCNSRKGPERLYPRPAPQRRCPPELAAALEQCRRGRERAQHLREEATQMLIAVMPQVRTSSITMTEAAQLVGMTRVSLHQFLERHGIATEPLPRGRRPRA